MTTIQDKEKDMGNSVTKEQVKYYFEQTFIGDEKWEVIADFLNGEYTLPIMIKDIKEQCVNSCDSNGNLLISEEQS